MGEEIVAFLEKYEIFWVLLYGEDMVIAIYRDKEAQSFDLKLHIGEDNGCVFRGIFECDHLWEVTDT